MFAKLLIVLALSGCATDGAIVDNYFDTRDRIADRLNPAEVDCARLHEMEVARLQAELDFLKRNGH
tara:strand:+ start:1623 stop:1820 length:198 start_codon:yes stop_codon:yes gene_type:complete